MAWNSLKSLLEEELPLSRSAASLKLRVLLLPAHANHCETSISMQQEWQQREAANYSMAKTCRRKMSKQQECCSITTAGVEALVAVLCHNVLSLRCTTTGPGMVATTGGLQCCSSLYPAHLVCQR